MDGWPQQRHLLKEIGNVALNLVYFERQFCNNNCNLISILPISKSL